MFMNFRHSILPATPLYFLCKITVLFWTKTTFIYLCLLRPPAVSFPDSQTNDLTSHFIEKMNCSRKRTTLSFHRHFTSLPASILPYAAVLPLQWETFLISALLSAQAPISTCFLNYFCSSSDPIFPPLSIFSFLLAHSHRMKTCLNITHLKQQSKLKTSLTPISTSICCLISLHPFMVKSPPKKIIANPWIHLPGSSSFLSLSVTVAKICFCLSPQIGISQVFPISVNDTIIYVVFRPQILESCLNSLSRLHYLSSSSVSLVTCASNVHLEPSPFCHSHCCNSSPSAGRSSSPG